MGGDLRVRTMRASRPKSQKLVLQRFLVRRVPKGFGASQAIELVHLGLDFSFSHLLWPRACAVGLHWLLQEVRRHEVVNGLMLVACHHGAEEPGRNRDRIVQDQKPEPCMDGALISTHTHTQLQKFDETLTHREVTRAKPQKNVRA